MQTICKIRRYKMASLDADKFSAIRFLLKETLRVSIIPWLSRYKFAGIAFMFTLPIAFFGAAIYFAPSSGFSDYDMAKAPTATTTVVSITTTQPKPVVTSTVPRADWVREETVAGTGSVSVTASSTNTASSSASPVPSTLVEPSSSPASPVASSTKNIPLSSAETLDPVPSSTATTETIPPSEAP